MKTPSSLMNPRHPLASPARRGVRSLTIGLVAIMLIGLLSAVGPGSSEPVEAHWPKVWIGSPVNAKWYSNPATHHTLSKVRPKSDWAVDLSRGSSSDRNVYVYSAVSNASDSRLKARVKDIIDNNSCRNGGGGDTVVVEILFDRTVMGQVVYTHLNRSKSLYEGKYIARWGGYLGKVSLSESGGSNCWTGPHVHLELRAAQDYSCWNKGFRYNQRVYRTNFVGFLSGTGLSSSRACP